MFPRIVGAPLPVGGGPEAEHGHISLPFCTFLCKEVIMEHVINRRSLVECLGSLNLVSHEQLTCRAVHSWALLTLFVRCGDFVHTISQP